MLKQEVADKLRQLVTPMKGNRIVEIGTGWAESARFFSELKPEWIVYTIDAFGLYGDGRIYNEWNHEKMLEMNQLIQDCGNVIQLLGDSSTIPWELMIDVLFLDGNHTEEGCRKDFERYAPFVVDGGIICFDDYTQENNPANGVKNVVQLALSSGRYEMIYEGYYCAILKKLPCNITQSY